jgi:hypothetical protein
MAKHRKALRVQDQRGGPSKGAVLGGVGIALVIAVIALAALMNRGTSPGTESQASQGAPPGVVSGQTRAVDLNASLPRQSAPAQQPSSQQNVPPPVLVEPPGQNR